MENLIIYGYNEILKATIESKKTEKADRKTIRKINNSYRGLKEIIKETREKKLNALIEQEKEKKAENKNYKKLTKKQLLESLKPKSVVIEIPKQKPSIIYIDKVNNETKGNVAGQELEKTGNNFIRDNRKKAEANRLEKLKKETKERAEWGKNEIEKRKKQIEQKKKIEVNQELQEKIKELKSGSYKIEKNDGKPIIKKTGFWIEKRTYDNTLKTGEKLGVWYDEKENNKLFLGCSVGVRDKEKAEKLGRKLGERAIWDCANNENVGLIEA